MHIIVGLGNPGREYVNTRHNIGYMAIDLLAKRLDIDVRREHHKAIFGEGRINGERIVLAKPITYMNNSGLCVRELINWYKCKPEELIVIYDDIDLPPGSLRIRERGSSGTHNGMRSIIYHLGFDNFPRIRVGIGTPEYSGQLIGHVLSPPSGEEMRILTESLEQAADAAELIAAGKIADAQARFNKKHANAKKPEKAEGDGNDNAEQK